MAEHSTPATSRRSKRLRVLAFTVVCAATLFALFHAVENWRGMRAIERMNHEITSRHETLDLSTLVPREIPDSQNFLATPTVQQWFKSKGNPAVLTNLWPDLVVNASKRLPADAEKGKRHLTDVAAWQRALQAVNDGKSDSQNTISTPEAAARSMLAALQIYEPVLNEFRANLNRPFARFPIDFQTESPFAILLPHLAQLRNVATVLSLRACAELAADDSAAALNDTLLLIRLEESLKDETFLISQLVRFAVLQTAAQPVWEGIERRRWTSEQLVALQRKLDAVECLPELARALSVERAAGIATIELARRKRSGNYISELAGSESQGGPAKAAVRLLPRGWFYMEAANYGRMLAGEIDLAKAQPFDPLAAVRATEQNERRLNGQSFLKRAMIDHNVAAAVLLPALGKVSLKFTAGETVARQAAAACALERYRLTKGALPETLNALVPQQLNAVPFDYFARKQMIYRRASTNSFVLYSIGSNARDDDGSAGKHPFDDKGDWVWKQGQ